MVDSGASEYTLMQSEQLFLRISANRIWYLKFILEGYDGIAALSTVDRQAGIVLLRFPTEQRNALLTLLADLAPFIGSTPPVSCDI